MVITCGPFPSGDYLGITATAGSRPGIIFRITVAVVSSSQKILPHTPTHATRTRNLKFGHGSAGGFYGGGGWQSLTLSLPLAASTGVMRPI